MINVKYTDTSLKVSGHAQFAPKGSDLVCAAVSAIVETSSSWFKKDELDIKLDKRNDVSIQYNLIKKTAENKNKMTLIVKQLQVLEKKFKKYIKITKGK